MICILEIITKKKATIIYLLMGHSIKLVILHPLYNRACMMYLMDNGCYEIYLKWPVPFQMTCFANLFPSFLLALILENLKYRE